MLLTRLTHGLLEFCYPGVCAACGADCPDGAGSPLCGRCERELSDLADSPACPRCARPLAMAGGPCPWCLGKGAAHLHCIVRLAPFAGPMKALVHRLKYRRDWPLAELLADRLAKKSDAAKILDCADLLVAVPLHPLRQISRGYNQAEVIARRLGRGHAAVGRPMIRIRHTPTQTGQTSHAQRYDNLRDAMAVTKPKAVAGRHVVLVDDVLTSGATLHAAASVLRRAGATRVSALVLAAADPHGYERPSGMEPDRNPLYGYDIV